MSHLDSPIAIPAVTDSIPDAELLQSIPREIPDEFWSGFHAQQKIRVAWLMFRIGAVMAALGTMTRVQALGEMIPILGFLVWIGALFAIVGGIQLFDLYVRRRPFRYFTNGRPMSAVIEDIALVPAQLHNGQINAYRFQADCIALNPSPAEPETFVCESELLSLDDKKRYTTTFQAGDVVTALYLPDDPAREMKLYGFLGLRPDLGIVQREDYRPDPWWNQFAVLGCLLGVFVWAIWSLYSMNRFAPLDDSAWHWLPSVLGAIVLGGGMLGIIALGVKHRQRQTAEHNRQAAWAGTHFEHGIKDEGLLGAGGWFFNCLCIFGALMIGNMTGWTTAKTANAMFDRSVPIEASVKIVDTSTDTSQLMRRHVVEFEFVDQRKFPAGKHRLAMSKAEIKQLGDQSVALVREGALGWRWVDQIQARARN